MKKYSIRHFNGVNSPITICRDSFDELIIAYKKEVGIDIAEYFDK